MTAPHHTAVNTTVKTTTYVEWLAHTNFSFLAGASHPHELLDQAAEFQLEGLCFTDFDGVYGLARAYRHWRKMPIHQRPKMFYGCEIHLDQDHSLPIMQQNTLALIAKSAYGYENICKIITFAHRHGKYNSFIAIEDLAQHDLHDIAAIIPMRGLIHREYREYREYREASKQEPERYTQQIQHLSQLFKEHLYVALSLQSNAAEDHGLPQQLQAAKDYAVKILITQDAFMHAAHRKPLSDTLQAIRCNATLQDSVSQMFTNDQRRLLSQDEFLSRYSSLPCFEQAMENSAALAASCNFSFAELYYRYPKEMIPPQHTAHSYLTAITWLGAEQTYHGHVPPKVKTTLMRELALIETLGFADYFLTVWDIVQWARKKNILCQGRGSAANSAVCFVLGITAVDPSQFDLLFERFMSVERGDPPDIDVDFEHERREEVIQYIYQRYGRDRAAMVANVITFRRKGALREVGKVFGIPEQILSKASDLMRSRVNAGKSLQDIFNILEETLQSDPSLSQVPKIPWHLWIQLAEELRGFPRHLGIHSGGFMIADRPLTSLVPCEPATMEGRSVVQWCKDDIEDLGFFKIDILALGILSAVRKCFALIKSNYQTELTLSTLPQEDPKTYQMIQAADTVGTFQIESRAQMSMLPRMRPKTFYDLVIEVAIIRPGPIQGGMIHPFLRRRHGLEPITYADERLRPILHRTLGIPIFQEQVMRIAMAVGDFTPGEANELRKNMGAWSMKGDLNPWLSKLARGMEKQNIPPAFAESILNQMKGFAEYGFPESHAVSFALIAYASSYLKCHYPAAFFTSILNSMPMGFYPVHTLIQSARHAGVSVLPICINHSQWDHQLEPLGRGSDEFAIRLGLRMIHGLRIAAAKHIENARQKSGPWSTWSNFLKHTKLFRHDLTHLAASNALKILGLDRRSAIWMAAAAPHSSWLEDVEVTLQLPDQTEAQAVQQDFQAIGTSLTAHPANLIRLQDWCFPIPVKSIKLACELSGLIPNQIISVFGMIVIQQRPPSAKGMMFITLEDETGTMNLALAPDVISKFAHALSSQSMLCISGKLQKQGHALSILVKTVYEPTILPPQIIQMQQNPLPPPSLPQAAMAQNQIVMRKN
jgi:error-prone DNA polymerase